MSARIRPEGVLAAVLVSGLLAAPAARAQTCTVNNVYPVFNTYLGGSGVDEVRDLQPIANNDRAFTQDLLLTGHTTSPSLPSGGTSKTGGSNVFVSRLSADGTRVRWSFIFGSDGDDSGARVAATPAGDKIYVVGRIEGTSTPEAYGFKVYSTSAGQTDAFLARLTGDGKPEWFLYLATGQEEEALGLALSGDAAYVVGKTKGMASDPFPRLAVGQIISRYGSSGNEFDAFLVKVPFSATPVPEWSRILATTTQNNLKGDDVAQAVLVVGEDIYFGGRLGGPPLNSEGVTVGPQCAGLTTGVVMKVGAEGRARWLTCLGGTGGSTEGSTEVQTLVPSPEGSLIAVGDTASSDFLAPGGRATSGRDVFAHAFKADGTLLDGYRVAAPGAQQVRGRVAVDSTARRLLLGGLTDSALFNGVTPRGRGFDAVFDAAGGDGFVLSLSTDLKQQQVEWGSYVGGKDGNSPESVAAVVFDEGSRLLLVAGTSSATDLMRTKTGAELKAPDLQNGFVLGLKSDPTPPVLTPGKEPEVRFDEEGRLEAQWRDLFTDAESGIARYEWSLLRANSTPEFTGSVEADQPRIEPSPEPGEGYTLQVQAQNGAGCVTRATSRTFDVDAPQSPLGWTCGVTDAGALPLGAWSLVALLRRVRRSRRGATWARACAGAPSA